MGPALVSGVCRVLEPTGARDYWGPGRPLAWRFARMHGRAGRRRSRLAPHRLPGDRVGPRRANGTSAVEALSPTDCPRSRGRCGSPVGRKEGRSDDDPGFRTTQDGLGRRTRHCPAGPFVLFNLTTATLTLLGILLGVQTVLEGATLLVAGRLHAGRLPRTSDLLVGPVQARCRVGSAENGDLVPQHERLDVLG